MGRGYASPGGTGTSLGAKAGTAFALRTSVSSAFDSIDSLALVRCRSSFSSFDSFGSFDSEHVSCASLESENSVKFTKQEIVKLITRSKRCPPREAVSKDPAAARLLLSVSFPRLRLLLS